MTDRMPERNLEDERSDDPHGPTCGCRECDTLSENYCDVCGEPLADSEHNSIVCSACLDHPERNWKPL